MNYRNFLCVLLFLVAMPAWAEEMSVEQAYGTLSTERVPFDVNNSRAEKKIAKYLDQLFFVTDIAVRLRIQTQQEFFKGNPGAVRKYNAEIDDLLGAFSRVETPKNYEYVEIMIIDAIREQQKFFNQWASFEGTAKYASTGKSMNSHLLVQSSHKKLIQAYYELMGLNPRETKRNQKAFYSHLCALDFI